MSGVQDDLGLLREVITDWSRDTREWTINVGDAEQAHARVAARLDAVQAELEAWHDWIDKPHREERWEHLLSLLPEEYQHIENLGGELARLRDGLRQMKKEATIKNRPCFLKLQYIVGRIDSLLSASQDTEKTA